MERIEDKIRTCVLTVNMASEKFKQVQTQTDLGSLIRGNLIRGVSSKGWSTVDHPILLVSV